MRTGGALSSQCTHRAGFLWLAGTVLLRGPLAEGEVIAMAQGRVPQGRSPGPAAAWGNLLEIQILRPSPDLLNQALWVWGSEVLISTSLAGESDAPCRVGIAGPVVKDSVLCIIYTLIWIPALSSV